MRVSLHKIGLGNASVYDLHSQHANSPSSKSCKRLATVSMAASLTIHSSSLVSSTNSDIMNAFVNSPLYKQFNKKRNYDI